MRQSPPTHQTARSCSRVASLLAITWALFQLCLPYFIILNSLTVRLLHLGFAISLGLLIWIERSSVSILSGKKLNIKVAAEIFADRNYEDDGNLVSRTKPNALITNPNIAKKHILSMVKNQAINCYSGKQIPCEIDSVCIHGDNENSLNTAKVIKEELSKNNLNLIPLNKMKKFT